MAAELLRCKEGFSYDDGRGVPVVVPAGALRPANHPDAKGREALFESAEAASTRQSSHGSMTPETASSAPGERRELSQPAKPGR